MKSAELFRVDDQGLIAEYEEHIAPHMGLSAIAIQMELQRRAALRLAAASEQARVTTSALAASSRRLERLTIGLLVLTLLLLIAAAPPAIEVMSRVFHQPRRDRPGDESSAKERTSDSGEKTVPKSRDESLTR